MIKQTFVVDFKDDGKRLFVIIAEQLDISKKRAQATIDSKMVLVNGRRVWIRGHEVKEDDLIEILIEDSKKPSGKHIAILWQDTDYLIVNKPAYFLTNADDESIEAKLQKQEKNKKICAVHRLDKETSGCVIFAKSPEAKKAMIPMFKGRDIVKVYRAITVGSFPKSWKEIRTDIDGLMSTTMVKLLDTKRHASYLELRIETGRTHQIRRHLADKRYPVMGDKKYGGTGNDLSIQQPRQMLHAYRIIFPHPKTGKPVRATAPLPGDFKKCLSDMKLK